MEELATHRRAPTRSRAAGRRAVVCFCLFSASLGLSARSGASEAGEAAAQNIEAAEDLLFKGKALLEKGQVEAARELLVVSMARHPVPKTYLLLGDCDEKLGKGLAAWLLFEKAHRAARESGDLAAAAEASRRASAIARTLTRLKVRVPTGVKDPTIIVDGRKLEPTEIDVAVPIDPGNHTLDVIFGGKRTFAMTFGFEFPKQLKEVPLPARAFNANSISATTEPRSKGPAPWEVGRGFLLATIGASGVTGALFGAAERDEHLIAPTVVSGAVTLGLFTTGLIFASWKDEPKDPPRTVHPFTVRVVPTFELAPSGGVRSAGLGLKGTF